jgi:hypothetical protein
MAQPAYAQVPGKLISPQIDILMLGGASIIFLLITQIIIDKGTSTYLISMLAFYMSFVINYPHFMLSYQLIYIDNRHKIFNEPKILWAAIIAPIILLLLMFYSVLNLDKPYLGYMVQFMLFTSGWHYVKQSYGIAILTSAISKIYYNKTEKLVLVFNTHVLWVYSWIFSQNGLIDDYMGVNFKNFELPALCRVVITIIFMLSSLLVGYKLMRKYHIEKTRPPTLSIISYLTAYVWLLPALMHPIYFYVIPFFHSLQYTLFVITLRRNKARDENQKLNNTDKNKYLIDFYGYLLLAIILGAAFFDWVPKSLDHYFPVGPDKEKTQLFLFAFTVFINVHHFIIDNAIWTRNNQDLLKYLIKPSMSTTPTPKLLFSTHK